MASRAVVSPFLLFDAWLAFLRARVGHEATIGDDGIGSGGRAFVWSQGVSYRGPQRCSKYPILSFSEDSLRAESKVRGTHLETQNALASSLLNPISAL